MDSLEDFEADCGRAGRRLPLVPELGPASSTADDHPPAQAHAAAAGSTSRSTRSTTARRTTSVQWADITAGLYDAIIDAYAAELLDITAVTPVYMCFHHEMENEEGKCGTADEFQAAYWYFRNRIQIVNGVPNLTWVVTYMGNTFRGKHGGPERWWPTTPPPGLRADQLMGIDIYNRNLCHCKGWRRFDWLTDKPWSSRRRSGGRCSSASAAASSTTNAAAGRGAGKEGAVVRQTPSSTCGTPPRRSGTCRSRRSATRT